MGSEFDPVKKQADPNNGQLAAIELLEHNLNALVYPVKRDTLKEVTKRFLIGTFDFSPAEADVRTEILDEGRDLPAEYEVDEESPEVVSEMLKLGLFDRLVEEYIVAYGEKAFDEWIEPFLGSVLRGHTEDTPSYEHLEECPDRFCPAVILGRMVSDQLCEYMTPLRQNIGYLPFSREFTYMNVKIVRLLQRFGVYSQIEADSLLDDYREWIESSEHPLSYDAALFDSLA